LTAKTGVNKQASIQLSDVQIYDAEGKAIDNIAYNNGTVTIGTP
jgi:hypothetical protein